MAQKRRTTFEAPGSDEQAGVVRELIAMMKENKKYWLIPILLMLLAFGVLILLGGTAAAPFIYTLF